LPTNVLALVGYESVCKTLSWLFIGGDMLHVASTGLEDRHLAPIGTHCILEIYGCAKHLLNDVEFIKHALREAAEEAQSTLLAQVEYKFDPHGVTALVLLAESHISIHTWPENGYAAVDVFTCGQHTRPEQACQYLIDAFQAQDHTLMTLARRTALEPKTEVPQERPLVGAGR
jgi:S-adenosylmethionine decarboxylase